MTTRRRVEGKAAIVVAGRHLESARETVEMIAGKGGQAWPVEADVTSEDADGGEGVSWGS